MDIQIKQTTADDSEILMKWRVEVLHEVFAIPEHQPTKKPETENRKYYERALRTGEHTACFACVDDQIVGCGGIGEAIITWLVSRATALGISKIYLETSKAGKSLYTKMGFAPMPDIFTFWQRGNSCERLPERADRRKKS